jgi:hypothetical protein
MRIQEIRMKRAAYILALIGLLSVLAGCKKQESDADGIRAGINQHLASLKTLNLDAMDMSITNISVQGNQAQAQVEFRPKTGGPSGAAMQIAYSLEKQNGVWAVQSTQAVGVAAQHPGPGEDPHMNGNAPSSGSLPNFRDLVPGSEGSGSLPPGHPPVSGQGNPRQ